MPPADSAEIVAGVRWIQSQHISPRSSEVLAVEYRCGCVLALDVAMTQRLAEVSDSSEQVSS
jgi:hypothetical protein